MLSISEYMSPTNESLGTSDDALLYRLGIYVLNAMENDRKKNNFEKYKITKNNPRAGVLRYMKDTNEPIIDPSKELIPRRSWDLDSLVGETEMQLMHPDYYKAINEVLKKHKRKHDVLTVCQCSAKKPYYTNRVWKPYADFFDNLSDFACISNPGIIPWEYSSCYPFRYDEWNIQHEKALKSILGMTEKYRIVNMCRLLRYKREMGYKHIISLIPNLMKNWIFDTLIEKNIDGAKDWCHVTITKQRFNAIKKAKPTLKGGFLQTRLGNFGEAKKAYARELKACIDKSDMDTFKKDYATLKDHISESAKEPGYAIKDSVKYTDVMEKFKKSIKANMDDPSVDKGDNDLYYKSYYWTCLDLLLIGMDGDLVKDIDGDYWDLHDKLEHDKDFIKISDFLYAYKPLMDNDDVTEETIKKEAFELELIQKPPVVKLKF